MKPDDHISTVDADGVALAAIQGLAERLEETNARIDELEAHVERSRPERAGHETPVVSNGTAVQAEGR